MTGRSGAEFSFEVFAEVINCSGDNANKACNKPDMCVHEADFLHNIIIIMMK